MSNRVTRMLRRSKNAAAKRALLAHPRALELPDFIRASIQKNSGIPPREGEPIMDYLARVVGMPRADVERFVNLIESGHTIEEAEAAVPSAAASVHPAKRC